MTKLYTLLILLSISASTATGQPTLTAATTTPTIGESYERSLFTPGPNIQGSSGANQVWDFSSEVEDAIASADVVDPASTPFGSMYPSATIALEVSTGAYEYLQANSSGLYRWGVHTFYSQVYSNSHQLLSYPFTYNSSFSDNYAAYITIPNDSGPMTGTATVTADGYGTLITPAGSFSNVLRIHSHHEETYSYENFGTIVQIYDLYTFWKPGLHYSLMEVMYGTQNGDPISSAGWSTSAVGINEVNTELFNLSVYPNPVKEKAALNFTLHAASDVVVEVSDALGKVFQTISLPSTASGTHSIPVDASRLSNGLYFVTVTIDGRRAMLRMIVDN